MLKQEWDAGQVSRACLKSISQRNLESSQLKTYLSIKLQCGRGDFRQSREDQGYFDPNTLYIYHFYSFGSVSNAEPIAKVKAIILADLPDWNCFLICKTGIIPISEGYVVAHCPHCTVPFWEAGTEPCGPSPAGPHLFISSGATTPLSAWRPGAACCEPDKPHCELWLCLIIPLWTVVAISVKSE